MGDLLLVHKGQITLCQALFSQAFWFPTLIFLRSDDYGYLHIIASIYLYRTDFGVYYLISSW